MEEGGTSNHRNRRNHSRGVAQEKALRLMLRPAADHRVHQDYISDHLELTGERKEEEEDSSIGSEVKGRQKIYFIYRLRRVMTLNSMPILDYR